jgi:hypothetical protein
MPVGLAASKASKASSSEAFRNGPSAVAELPSRRIALNTVFDFNDNELEPDKEIGQSVIWDDEIIGIDGIESDVAISADLRIRAAWEFKVDGERSDHGILLVDVSALV